ncbi:MAG TPA: UDP-N-acetylmuramate--L-alanine ligase [Ktedonobacterales bacterium]|nr:UDP-N-acetylmuramate--L-alanine ligase [Ktedonobacterales bacterium]
MIQYSSANQIQTIQRKRHIHFLGIGGHGCSAVAQLAKALGEEVSGCERVLGDSEATRLVQAAGIDVVEGHSPNHLAGIDLLVHVPAALVFDPNNPEVQAAAERGIRVITWQELLGEYMQSALGISIAGSHGKGTTTTMISLILVDAGLDPTCEIGAVVPRFHSNFRLGQSRYFVNEADEYNFNFLHYHPRLAVITNFDLDHVENYPTFDDYLAGFERFVRGMDMSNRWDVPPTLIISAEGNGVPAFRRLLADWPGRVVTYGLDPASKPDFLAKDTRLVGETSFEAQYQGASLGRFSLLVPGQHLVHDALAAIAATYLLGVTPDQARASLAGFAGLQRRFEVRSTADDRILIDDYGHHPTEVAATIAAARLRYPTRRIIAVFQPALFSRTKSLFDEFVAAFDLADEVIISDIYGARERDPGDIHSQMITEAIRQRPAFLERPEHVFYGGSLAETRQLLEQMLAPNDVALLMGSGTIYKITEDMVGPSPTLG